MRPSVALAFGGPVPALTAGWRPYALLLALALALYLPGLASLPVTDRDEARFAQATRQMLESGDFLRIRFQDEARNNKPAGIYWLQAASVAMFAGPESSAIWPYRMPSVIGATAAVLLTFALGAGMVGRAAALAGAALLAGSLELAIEAHLAKTDAVLLALSVAAQGALFRVFAVRTRGTAGWALLFWLAQGAAILVKGPVTPALSALTALALALVERDARWLRGLRPLWGVPLLVLIVAPWLVAISVATKGAFLGQSVGQDFLAKIGGAEESHGAWPGTYLAAVWATFWPGSLLLPAAAVLAWRERHDPSLRFLAAWAVPFWIALELVPTKLPQYLLPVFPALALLAGRAALAGAALPRASRAAGAVPWAIASLVLAALLAGAPFALGLGPDPAGLLLALVILVYGAGVAWRAVAAPGLELVPRALLLAVAVVPAALAIEAPRLDPLWLSRAAGRLAAADAPGAAVAAVGYAEPSLVFLLGTRTLLATPESAAERLGDGDWAALVESRDEAPFHAALEARHVPAEAIGTVAGLDYSNGRRMRLTLYRRVSAPR